MHGSSPDERTTVPDRAPPSPEPHTKPLTDEERRQLLRQSDGAYIAEVRRRLAAAIDSFR